MMPQGITRSPPGNASGHHPVPAGKCLKASPVLKGLGRAISEIFPYLVSFG